MIIEDNKDIQEIYKHSFEKYGYEVFIEENGQEGLDHVVEKMPDIILLDLMMPEMDGFEFLRLMKENTTLNIPVIVCSNISDNDISAKIIDAGAVAMILKVDYSGKQLVEKVEYILNESGDSPLFKSMH